MSTRVITFAISRKHLKKKTFAATIVMAAIICLYGINAEDKGSERNTISDQDFALTFSPEDFLSMSWRLVAPLTKDVRSTIKTDKNHFTINLDVQHFSPEEITVKTAGGYVVIEAKHEEKKDDHGYISRQFVRRYSLPEGTEPDTVTCMLSSDGVLTISAPKKGIEERLVPLTQTGPVRREAADEQGTCQGEACVGAE